MKNIIEFPFIEGQKVFKICPKCNPRHNGSCKNCAWAGCDFHEGCSIYDQVEHTVQVVEKKVFWGAMKRMKVFWNFWYFPTRDEAQKRCDEINGGKLKCKPS